MADVKQEVPADRVDKHNTDGDNDSGVDESTQGNDHYYMSVHEWTEEPRPLTRCRSARAPRTPRTPRALSPRKHCEDFEEEERISRNNERNRRASMARPASARAPMRTTCARPTSLSQRPAFTVY